MISIRYDRIWYDMMWGNDRISSIIEEDGIESMRKTENQIKKAGKEGVEGGRRRWRKQIREMTSLVSTSDRLQHTQGRKEKGWMDGRIDRWLMTGCKVYSDAKYTVIRASEIE